MPNAFEALASGHVQQEARDVLAKLDELEPDEPDFEQLLSKHIKAVREYIAVEESRACLPPVRRTGVCG